MWCKNIFCLSFLRICDLILFIYEKCCLFKKMIDECLGVCLSQAGISFTSLIVYVVVHTI